jgi:tetratricopeptide (TPR) repeat protein
MMAGFTRALGVRCTYCHVGQESIPLEQYDFASDEKAAKRKARTMIEMLRSINDVQLAGLAERASPAIQVQCFTCHRGATQPRTLQEVLTHAYQAGGIDSTVAAYDALRRRYYGRAVYDFGEVALIDVANPIAAAGNLAGAERLLELNVRMNAESEFARTRFMTIALLRSFVDGSPESGRKRYAELKSGAGGRGLPEPILNAVGYDLLRRSRHAEAIAAFELNVAEYPQSANTHDSLGDALAASGDTARAIASYERALELNPRSTATAGKLQELRRRR